MRNAVVLASLLVSSIAGASPEDAPAPPPSSGSYVELGTAIGGTQSGAPFAGLLVDGGYRLGGTPLWLHAAALEGGVLSKNLVDPGWTGMTSGNYLELRGGMEAHACTQRGTLCGIGGVDLGYHREAAVIDSTPDNRIGMVVVERGRRFRRQARARARDGRGRRDHRRRQPRSGREWKRLRARGGRCVSLVIAQCVHARNRSMSGTVAAHACMVVSSAHAVPAQLDRDAMSASVRYGKISAGPTVASQLVKPHAVHLSTMNCFEAADSLDACSVSRHARPSFGSENVRHVV
jgi:hypothetical protein